MKKATDDDINENVEHNKRSILLSFSRAEQELDMLFDELQGSLVAAGASQSAVVEVIKNHKQQQQQQLASYVTMVHRLDVKQFTAEGSRKLLTMIAHWSSDLKRQLASIKDGDG